MNCFLVFLSLTQVQRAVEVLRAQGLSVSVVRPPLTLGRGSCSYAVLLRRAQLARARSVLAAAGLCPEVYDMGADGAFREVRG